MTDCERCWTVLQKMQCKTSTNVLYQKYAGRDLTLKQMIDISEKLIIEQSGEILECLKSARKILHGENYHWSMMKKSSVSRMQRSLCIFRFCVMSWKYAPEPNIKYYLGRQVNVVQEFITVQNFGHNWRRADGIRVEYFLRIHHIAGRRQSPRVHEQNGRPSTIPRKNYLHVDVQWPHMEIYRQWTGMYC